MTNLLQHFPSNYKARESQLEALRRIEKGFETKKIVILSAPTGVGKSHVGIAVCNSSKVVPKDVQNIIRSYDIYKRGGEGSYTHEDLYEVVKYGGFLLTISKNLQDQYKEIFGHYPAGKGKNNFECELNKDLTADCAPCIALPKIKNDCFKKDHCQYYRNRNDCLADHVSILNYRYYFNLPNFLRRREVIICDEACKIEDELVGQFTVNLDYQFLNTEGIKFNKVLNDDKPAECLQWLNDVYIQFSNRCKEQAEKVNAAKDSGDYSKYLKETQHLTKMIRYTDSIGGVIDRWSLCEFVTEKYDKGLIFAPFNIAPLFRQIMENCSRMLLMSATITDVKTFARVLGIKESEYEFIDMPSPFDVQKSPIKCSSKHKLSYATMKTELPKVIDLALEICKNHSKEKGIIHTHTNFIAESIAGKVKTSNRFLIRQAGSTNEQIIKMHKFQENNPTVLVSPSMDMGVSLDDELGRFQIIIKAPYLPLGSKRIKMLFDKDKKYYTMKMLSALIQMCGRCTRSQDDHSVTYILDGNITRVIMQERENLPKHFIDRFV